MNHSRNSKGSRSSVTGAGGRDQIRNTGDVLSPAEFRDGTVSGETLDWGPPALGPGWEESHRDSLGLTQGLPRARGSHLLTPGSGRGAEELAGPHPATLHAG